MPDLTPQLPSGFITRLSEIVPSDKFATVFAAFGRERETAFRVNTLLAKPDATIHSLNEQGFHLAPVAGILDGAYTVAPQERRSLTETPECSAGHIYIQNPASMLPPLVLTPQADEKILDLAAAPGSKTLHIAALMGNTGWISAVEAVRERFFRLKSNLEKHGATNVHTYLRDGSKVFRQVPEEFDRVLLDAPCSSEGQFSMLHPASFAYWSEKKIGDMSRKQKQLLYSAVQCLKPGGTLIYSTCTLAPEENEMVVHGILKKFPAALEIVPITLNLPQAMPGLTAWRNKNFHPSIAGTVRILPDHRFEGFFICHLRKTAGTIG